MSDSKQMSKHDAIECVIDQLDGPYPIADFVEQVLAIWPTKSKRPTTAVRKAIKDEHLGRTIIYLDKTTLISATEGLESVRFRVPILKENNKSGLFIAPVLQYLLPKHFEPEQAQFFDSVGHSIPADFFTARIERMSRFGPFEKDTAAFEIGWWFKKNDLDENDSVIISMLDFKNGHFQLEPERQNQSQEAEEKIAINNQKVADALFDMLENEVNERLYAFVAIPTILARLKQEHTYPADHWLAVLENDQRMAFNQFDIQYADPDDYFDESDEDEADEIPAEDLQKVYRFKASLRHQKGLWRRIDIQAGQTLYDFDLILKTAFEHDWDHMSGFWQLFKRGKTKRTRKIELATIAPFSEDSRRDHIRIIELNLQVDDSLEYVYDFGDWVDHHITLEKISAHEAEKSYPNIVEQNKPRYKYCPTCAEKEVKTIATYCCIWCSNEQQKDVLTCEACSNLFHEEHYLDEMIY